MVILALYGLAFAFLLAGVAALIGQVALWRFGIRAWHIHILFAGAAGYGVALVREYWSLSGLQNLVIGGRVYVQSGELTEAGLSAALRQSLDGLVFGVIWGLVIWLVLRRRNMRRVSPNAAPAQTTQA